METYEASYFSETHKLWFEHPDVRLFDKIYRELSVMGSNASIMDVGCGSGNLLRFAGRVENPLSYRN